MKIKYAETYSKKAIMPLKDQSISTVGNEFLVVPLMSPSEESPKEAFQALEKEWCRGAEEIVRSFVAAEKGLDLEISLVFGDLLSDTKGQTALWTFEVRRLMCPWQKGRFLGTLTVE